MYCIFTNVQIVNIFTADKQAFKHHSKSVAPVEDVFKLCHQIWTVSQHLDTVSLYELDIIPFNYLFLSLTTELRMFVTKRSAWMPT